MPRVRQLLFLLGVVSIVAAPGQAQKSASPTATAAERNGAAVSTQTRQRGSTDSVADITQMSEPQFKALPSTAMVRWEGQTMTKAAFIELRNQEVSERLKALDEKARAAVAAKIREFEQQQTSELAAKNARVRAVAESYERRAQQLFASPAYAALIREAEGIIQRYPSASPSEKARMKERAAEIHDRLAKMEADAAAGR